MYRYIFIYIPSTLLYIPPSRKNTYNIGDLPIQNEGEWNENSGIGSSDGNGLGGGRG